MEARRSVERASDVGEEARTLITLSSSRHFCVKNAADQTRTSADATQVETGDVRSEGAVDGELGGRTCSDGGLLVEREVIRHKPQNER